MFGFILRVILGLIDLKKEKATLKEFLAILGKNDKKIFAFTAKGKVFDHLVKNATPITGKILRERIEKILKEKTASNIIKRSIEKTLKSYIMRFSGYTKIKNEFKSILELIQNPVTQLKINSLVFPFWKKLPKSLRNFIDKNLNGGKYAKLYEVLANRLNKGDSVESIVKDLLTPSNNTAKNIKKNIIDSAKVSNDMSKDEVNMNVEILAQNGKWEQLKGILNSKPGAETSLLILEKMERENYSYNYVFKPISEGIGNWHYRTGNFNKGNWIYNTSTKIVTGTIRSELKGKWEGETKDYKWLGNSKAVINMQYNINAFLGHTGGVGKPWAPIGLTRI